MPQGVVDQVGERATNVLGVEHDAVTLDAILPPQPHALRLCPRREGLERIREQVPQGV